MWFTRTLMILFPLWPVWTWELPAKGKIAT
jgi:hypothetical protein